MNATSISACAHISMCTGAVGTVGADSRCIGHGVCSLRALFTVQCLYGGRGRDV